MRGCIKLLLVQPLFILCEVVLAFRLFWLRFTLSSFGFQYRLLLPLSL